MAKSHNQKAKILILEQMLCSTGENCVVTMQEILERLTEYGIRAERKSIYDDIEALRDFGMDIRFRRGKPGGYYLAGNTEIKSSVLPEKENVPESQKAEKEPEVVRSGLHPDEIQDMSKTMKLHYKSERRDEVEAYFGTRAEYKEKDSNELTVIVPLTAGPYFYGWLTAMNGDVRISKPKKAAAAYRDYLKSLAREYKGI